MEEKPSENLPSNNHEEEHHVHHIKKINATDTNYWMFAAIILSVLLIASVIVGFSSGNSVSGNAISKDKASEDVLAFLNKQTGGGVVLDEMTDVGYLYEAKVSYQGQQIPIYITKDEKFFGSMSNFQELSTKQAETPATTQTPSATLTKTDKPVVEAFVMSHCPYGTQMEKGLIPVIETLGDKIDFKLKFVYYSMHGAKEVNEETTQYCIQKNEPAKLIPYLKCFLADETKSAECVAQVGIDKTKLDSCIKEADTKFSIQANLADTASYLSGQFPLYNVDKADNDKYSVGGSPTLIINGQDASSSRDSAALLKTICGAFNTAPEECNTVLSSASPSPGFGFTTTDSASTSAQCA